MVIKNLVKTMLVEMISCDANQPRKVIGKTKNRVRAQRHLPRRRKTKQAARNAILAKLPKNEVASCKFLVQAVLQAHMLSQRNQNQRNPRNLESRKSNTQNQGCCKKSSSQTESKGGA